MLLMTRSTSVGDSSSTIGPAWIACLDQLILLLSPDGNVVSPANRLQSAARGEDGKVTK